MRSLKHLHDKYIGKVYYGLQPHGIWEKFTVAWLTISRDYTFVLHSGRQMYNLKSCLSEWDWKKMQSEKWLENQKKLCKDCDEEIKECIRKICHYQNMIFKIRRIIKNRKDYIKKEKRKHEKV